MVANRQVLPQITMKGPLRRALCFASTSLNPYPAVRVSGQRVEKPSEPRSRSSCGVAMWPEAAMLRVEAVHRAPSELVAGPQVGFAPRRDAIRGASGVGASLLPGVC